MNKVARVVSSTLLATGLALGSSVTAFADNNNYDRGQGSTRYDDHRNDRPDRGDRDRYDRGRVFIIVCFDHQGRVRWAERYDNHHRDRYNNYWNCRIIRHY
ncbi:hypothetical protein [Pseudarthrobacter enclensis]|uniref:hypothetical protein n=1 Tax=Pseudarthrobacter enclensis TaxID=993070 RepID=UPI003EE1156B